MQMFFALKLSGLKNQIWRIARELQDMQLKLSRLVTRVSDELKYERIPEELNVVGRVYA